MDNCNECIYFNHYDMPHCQIGSNGIPGRYGHDPNIVPEWCPINKPPLKWERLGGMTPGGNPCVRCPVCKARESEHLIGIGSGRHWKYCPMCGERLDE